MSTLRKFDRASQGLAEGGNGPFGDTIKTIIAYSEAQRTALLLMKRMGVLADASEGPMNSLAKFSLRKL